MCDEHIATQKVPMNCILNKLANEAEWPCNQCEQEADAARDLAAEAERQYY